MPNLFGCKIHYAFAVSQKYFYRLHQKPIFFFSLFFILQFVTRRTGKQRNFAANVKYKIGKFNIR
jgi:hypothetical protein